MQHFGIPNVPVLPNNAFPEPRLNRNAIRFAIEHRVDFLRSDTLKNDLPDEFGRADGIRTLLRNGQHIGRNINSVQHDVQFRAGAPERGEDRIDFRPVAATENRDVERGIVFDFARQLANQIQLRTVPQEESAEVLRAVGVEADQSVNEAAVPTNRRDLCPRLRNEVPHPLIDAEERTNGRLSEDSGSNQFVESVFSHRLGELTFTWSL